MSTLATILKARAATYMGTSMVAITDGEYQQYLQTTVDFNYPHLKTWSEIYNDYDTTEERRDAILQLLNEWISELPLSDTDLYSTASLIEANLSGIDTLYKKLCLALQPDDDEDLLSLYEWWLGTPTGPESCSRDVGELRNTFASTLVGRGDEWEIDLELAVMKYQVTKSTFIAVPTGYCCTETLRRLRLDA